MKLGTAEPRLGSHADVAQLVEHHLAKVGVAGSSPVVRSLREGPGRVPLGVPRTLMDGPERARLGGVAEWLGKGLQNPVHRFNSGPRLERTVSRSVQSHSSGA